MGNVPVLKAPSTSGHIDVTNAAHLHQYDACRLDELILMWRASFDAGVGVIDPHPLSEQRCYFLTEVLPRNEVRLAVQQNVVVGFVAASAESVAQLYVHVGYQGRGIGTQLLTWAKERSNATLWLYTYARNLGARAFYERHGFVAVAHGFEPILQLYDIKYQWVMGMHNVD